jgi:uncharacterized protein
MIRELINDLNNWKSSPRRKPLILRGARQVGKSWLLKEFGKSFAQFHYLNLERDVFFHEVFEDLNPHEVLRKISIKTKKKIDITKDLLIIDEIQECPRALTSLKYFCEDMPELAVCSAGSHIGVTFCDASYPVGKSVDLQLYPMNFKEYLSYHHSELIDSYESNEISNFEHDLLWKAYLNYSYVGGMPEAVLQFSDKASSIQAVRQAQLTLLHAYQADFAKHSGKQNASHILATYENIPKQLQNSYDNSIARFKFKGIIPNRSKYSQFKGPIDWLVHTGLILKCSSVETPKVPLKAYEKENLFKLLYADTGLLNAALELNYMSIVNQDYGSYKGFVAENFVAQELIQSGSHLRFWKKNDSSSAAEIEFLFEKDTHIIPIEVKSGIKSLNSKSLVSYKNKYEPSCSIKLSGKNLRFENNQLNAPIYLAGRLNQLLQYYS